MKACYTVYNNFDASFTESCTTRIGRAGNELKLLYSLNASRTRLWTTESGRSTLAADVNVLYLRLDLNCIVKVNIPLDKAENERIDMEMIGRLGNIPVSLLEVGHERDILIWL